MRSPENKSNNEKKRLSKGQSLLLLRSWEEEGPTKTKKNIEENKKKSWKSNEKTKSFKEEWVIIVKWCWLR